MNLPTLRVRSAILGDYLLVPHAADEGPGSTMLGYVVLEGEDKMRRAIRPRGDWRDDKNRPFTKPLVAWYSMEKPDGSPLI